MKLFSDKEAVKMIQSIRADHSNFPKFLNSSVLIDILNSFAKTDCALPPHWEKKIDRKTKKVVQILLPSLHVSSSTLSRWSSLIITIT